MVGFGWVADVLLQAFVRSPTLIIFLRIFQRYCSVCVSSFDLRTMCTTTLTPCKALVGNILYPVGVEYQYNPPFLSLAMGLGVFVDALFWGFSSDIWGRRSVYSPVR